MKRNLVKKIAAVTILAALTMTVAAGCGNKQDQEEPKEETSQEAPAEEETAEAETEKEDIISEAEAEIAETEAEIDAKEAELSETEEEMAEEFMPGCFLDERTGKDIYDSYDEIIGDLTGDEAYAMVKLTGSDEDILLITEMTWDNLDGNQAAMDAAVYLPNEKGKIICGSSITSAGTAYPISVADGVLYTAGGHCVETSFISEEYGSFMIKDYVFESFDDKGNASYTGFLREKNNFDESNETEVTDENGKEVLEKLFDQFNNAEVVNFTVVGK